MYIKINNINNSSDTTYLRTSQLLETRRHRAPRYIGGCGASAGEGLAHARHLLLQKVSEKIYARLTADTVSFTIAVGNK